jgi:alpha-beta hydrolase superfamily lysophospholipase
VKFRSWMSPEPAGAIVLIHGMGAGTERWESLARYFLTKNISSYALSLQGFDETPGVKGYVDSFETYHSDVKELFDIARREIPEGSIFLLGESMGAVIAFDIASRGRVSFEGYILISPAFGSKLKFPPLTYFAIMISMAIFPKKQFRMPFTSQMCTSDNEEIDKMQKNPAEHRYATGRLLREIFKRQVTGPILARKIDSKILFLLSMNDEIADPKKSVKIFKKIKSSDKTIRTYPGMRHALSVEAGREEVFKDIYEWGEWGKGEGVRGKR